MPNSMKAGRLNKVAVCLMSMCCNSLYSSVVIANPSGADVVNGSASFDQQGSQLNITNSHGTIINWDEFSIAQNEAVKFLQDNANSAVLNRVVGQLPSDILGELSSNGKLFLINPNGLLIGNGARIDTSGFVASTLDISNEDFVAGNMNFKGNGGHINNQGYITAGRNGEVILIAPQIENSGIIEAQDGNILLAAGREVTLHSLDNPGIAFRVSSAGDKVLNLGQLLAENGSVKVFADQVVQQGTISANRMSQRSDGTIVLEADTFTEVSGSVSAKGNNVDGGDIHILGDEVRVKNATIDASGESGGEILVGGDYQGNGTVKNARTTDVDAATVINADAGSIGDGGRVIVWSDDTTNTYGKITARGGSQSGDGGFVETSGKKTLDFGQPADVSAANGAAGTWLLDPEDIVIDEAKADSISSSLNGGSNVEVKTSDDGDGEGNITVAAAITKTEGDDAVSLTLDAHNRVDVNEPITSTAGPLNVNIKTGRTVANAEVEEPAQVPEVPNDAPDEMVASDEEPQVAEESDDSELDLMADDTDEGIDNQLNEAQQANDDALAQVEEVVPEVEDTEIESFIDEDVQQIVITEDIDTAGGSISIQAGEEGDVIISSSLTTSQSSDSEDQQAGDITIEAKRIALTDDAEVDASGEDAGTILIGGDQQGQNDEVQNADFVYVGEDAKIKADGGKNGDGGKVIVFAKDTAIVQGIITAKGGTESGDGGFIETSGLKGLRVTKAPDASATNGKRGEWLIDPYNFTIGSGSDVFLDPIFAAAPWFVHPSASGAFISSATLKTALLAGDVTVDTTDAGSGGESGNIIFEANIDFDDIDSNGTGSLSLFAHNDIYFRGNLIDSDSTYSGNNNDLTNLNLVADSDGDNNGSVYFDGPNLVGSANGVMNVEVNNDINVSGDDVFIIGSPTDDGFGFSIDSINLRADNDGDSFGDINFGTMLAPIGNDATDLISLQANKGSINLNAENINFYSAGGIDIDAGTADGAFIAVHASYDILFDAGAMGNIEVNAGTVDNTYVDVMAAHKQTFDAYDIFATGGDGASASVAFFTTGDQSFTATNDIQFEGGTGDSSDAGATSMGDQDFNSDTLSLLGGRGMGATAYISLNSGGTQTINTAGKLTLQAGSVSGAEAFIEDVAGGAMSQIIHADGGLDLISTSNATAFLYSDLNQIITVGTAATAANLNLMGADVVSASSIDSGGDQAITVYGDLVIDFGTITSVGGGGGGSPNTIDVTNLKAKTGSIVYLGYDGLILTTTGSNSEIDGGASGDFVLDTLTWNQQGTVDWKSGDISLAGYSMPAYIDNSGTFYVNSETGPANAGSGTLNDMMSGGFYNSGTVEKNSGTGVTILNTFFSNDGDVIAGSGTIDFGTGSFEQNSGETLLEGGSISSISNIINFYGGELNGGVSALVPTGGQITGDVFLQDTTVNPGHSAGDLSFSGDLDASAGGNTFNMEIGGTAPGDYDRIIVGGVATIPATNTMNINFINGYSGPTVIDGMDTFPDVISSRFTGTVTPMVTHAGDDGLTKTDSQVGNNLELIYTRVFFPETIEEETIEEMGGGTMGDSMMETVGDTMGGESPPDIINLIVTITEEQKQALIDAGLLDPDEDDDDKKDKPNTKQMCVDV